MGEAQGLGVLEALVDAFDNKPPVEPSDGTVSAPSGDAPVENPPAESPQEQSGTPEVAWIDTLGATTGDAPVENSTPNEPTTPAETPAGLPTVLDTGALEIADSIKEEGVAPADSSAPTDAAKTDSPEGTADPVATGEGGEPVEGGGENAVPGGSEAAPGEGDAVPAEGAAAPGEGEATLGEGETPGEAGPTPGEGEPALGEGEAEPNRSVRDSGEATPEDAMLLRVAREGWLPELSERENLLAYAREKRVQLELADKVRAAKKLDMAIVLLARSLGEDVFGQSVDKEQLRARLDRAIASRSRIVGDYQRHDGIVQERWNKALSDEDQRFKKELDDLSDKYSSPKFLVRFNKPSSELAQLRILQKALEDNGDWDAAERTGHAVRRREEYEAQEASRRAELSLRNVASTANAKHKQLIQTIEGRRGADLAHSQRLKERELEANSMLIRMLESRLRGPPKIVKPKVESSRPNRSGKLERPPLPVKFDVDAIIQQEVRRGNLAPL